MSAKVWTTGRKWMGNILPAIFYLPPAVIGSFLMWLRQEFFGLGLILLGISVAVGWIALNFLGLAGNAFARRQLRREINARGGLPSEAIFVGFARQEYRSALDPHEDLGFLAVRADRLEFQGESQHAEVFRRSITRIRFRPNIHTWVGLGRWISVESMIDGRASRVLIEPRERHTMLGNLFFGKRLIAELLAWKGGTSTNDKP